MKVDTIAVVSGGLDSSVLLHKLARDGRRPLALSFDYKQRHRRELSAAAVIAEQVGARHVLHPLTLPAVSALQGVGEVPDGHYADESMRATVVPSRNLVMLAIASAYAVASGAGSVAYAAHGGDHAIYPDCRLDFVEATGAALALANWDRVDLVAPFISMTKAQIVGLGAQLDVPFELTWSCYKGGRAHCGTCGTCVERREAFELAGVKDPTEYLR